MNRLSFCFKQERFRLLNGEFEITPNSKTLSKTKFADDEVSECLKKGEHIAKWFATAGKVETIYIELGVRP